MKQIKLAPNIRMPIDIAGQTIGLLGIRGSGKTNTAACIAEELLDQNHPIVAIDPTDAWWGLRSEYPVFIFGGPHGDIPLQETDGKVIAEFVVNEQVPIILSLRHLRKNAQRRFVMEFCEELYHLKGRDGYRSPLTVFIDEAPLFVPQKVIGEVARVVGAVEDLIARGRNAGFGVVLISQRPATINKDVLTQADTIITHRLTSPQDRKALSEWIEENATIEKQKEVLTSLAGMPNGKAWVWSPRLDVFEQAQIRLRHTFDSSATPKVGEAINKPKDLKSIDLGKLKDRLASSLEKAKSEDPKLLKAEILELKKQVAEKKPIASPVIDKEAISDAVYKAVEKERGLFAAFLKKKDKQLTSLIAKAEALKEEIGTARNEITDYLEVQDARTIDLPRAIKTITVDGVTETKHRPLNNGESISAPKKINSNLSVAQKILAAVAELMDLGVARPPRIQVAFLSGYSNLQSTGFKKAVSQLRSDGLIEYPDSESITLTELGSEQAARDGKPLTSEELQSRVISLVGGIGGRMIQRLIEAYPHPMNRMEFAQEMGYTNLQSTGFKKAIGKLRSLGFVDYPSTTEIMAKSILFIN